MVYGKVEIWRGVILSRKEAIKLGQEFGEDIPDDEEDIYEICACLEGFFDDDGLEATKMAPCCGDNDVIIVGRIVKKYPRASFSWKNVPLENRERVKQIQATCFRKRGQQCGNLIPGWEDSEHEYGGYCGYYVACDHCVGVTTNGYYDVRKILNQTVEAIDYCATCNRDRCDLIERDEETFDMLKTTFGNLGADKIIDYKYQLEKREHLDGEDQNSLTVNQLVDQQIREWIEEEDYPIKNYYRLNDCLSCT